MHLGVINDGGDAGNSLGTTSLTAGTTLVTKPLIATPATALQVVNLGSGHGITGFSTSGIGVGGSAAAGNASPGLDGFSDAGDGVHGFSNAASGVRGEAFSSVGVFGVATSSNPPGVAAPPGPVGVAGSAPNGGIGIRGLGTSGDGVLGSSSSGSGVHGVSTGSYGVLGESRGSNGVVGVGGGTAAGCAGFTLTAGGYGIYGASTVPGGYAGGFVGSVLVNGPFTAVNGPKSAAVPHPDGSHRRLYCQESPEPWFEDFGKGRLANGRADVRLDADFAAVVHSDDYHVFLTEYGDSGGLYVANLAVTGFEVRARAAAANGAFGYRVVARRKDIPGPRLEKVSLPELVNQLTAPPDPTKLYEPTTPRSTSR